MTDAPTLKFGVIGIGNAGGGVLSSMRDAPNVEVVAVADVRPHARDAFQQRFGGRAYETAEELCADPEVQAVWVATPNPFHRPHTVMAAEHGKHVVVEKPMALDLNEAAAMIDAADKNGVLLLSGHTRAFDPPVQAMSRVIQSGEIGALKAMNDWSFTNWMLRPRMPEEVDEQLGGGVAFRQAPHQIDTIRFLVAASSRASAARRAHGWKPDGRSRLLRRVPGVRGRHARVHLLQRLWLLPCQRTPPWEYDDPSVSVEQRSQARRNLQAGDWDEQQAKDDGRFGGAVGVPQGRPGGGRPSRAARFMNDLGLLIVTCERGVLRQSPNGVYVYNDDGVREEPISGADGPGPSDPTLQEAYDGIVLGRPSSTMDGGGWRPSRSRSRSCNRRVSTGKCSCATRSRAA